MSSNIEITRICEQCGNVFTARTTTTRCCSHTCANRAYKARKRTEKVSKAKAETTKKILQPIESINAKEFLTVNDVARLLNCSVRTVYYQIEAGTIKAFNIGQRLTRVKRSEIDNLFIQPEKNNTPEQKEYSISDSYTISEVIQKFNVSEKTVHELIKRESIPKIKKGRFAYVPKAIIEKLLT